MSSFDPKAVLAEQARRGVPAGVVVAIVLSSICLALFLLLFLAAGRGFFVFAVPLSFVTLVPMMAGVMALDRLEPEPRYLLAAVLLWGAGSSVVLSLIFEALGAITLYATGNSTDTAVAVGVAPVVEETMKALALFGIFWWRRGQINGITDGVVYAATTALGFAAAENIEYYIAAALTGGSASMGHLFLLRGVMTPFCHPVFTSMTGLAIGLAVRRKGAARALLPVGGLVLAIGLHATWNALASLGVPGMGAGMVIVLGALAGILTAVHADWKRTVSRIEACMTAYLPTGLITRDDIWMLSTMARRKHARQWARATHGKVGLAAMSDYQQACTKLTMLNDRASFQAVTPALFEYQRWALLTLMRFAREAFLAPTAAPIMPAAAMPPVFAPPTFAPPVFAPPAAPPVFAQQPGTPPYPAQPYAGYPPPPPNR